VSTRKRALGFGKNSEYLPQTKIP